MPVSDIRRIDKSISCFSPHCWNNYVILHSMELNEQATDQYDKVPSYMQQNFPKRATFWTDNEERTKIHPEVFK